jgi:hypothetical protein
MELKELKELHDKAFNHNSITRERAADDTVFYYVTQWDDGLLGDTELQYRGEFNVIRKAGRQIMADLRANPIQVDFDPKAGTRQDGADLLDGLYLSDDRVNSTQESYDNASNEAVVCGIGAWELYTEYESNRAGNENQVIRRRPIYEANSNCFFDPNSKSLDKSDAMYVSILTAYSFEGYEELYEELTGEESNGNTMDSFANPEESYSFPWVTGKNESVYVVTFYHKKKVKDKIITLVDPVGETLMLRESDLTDVMDDMLDMGYEVQEERSIERWQVTKYLASGSEILSEDIIAGENIPVVPTYGERAFVEGEEHYEGVTRLAKDPQRLRNFQMSYLADIVSRSPRPKPIFNPEQLQGFEFMYDTAGADNNYPYMLMNSKDGNGQPLPLGPVSQMPEQQVPQALMLSMQESRMAVEDVANPGLPNDIADTDLSGKAVQQLQQRLDQQSIVYQQNLKHAKRRDAEIYASMATVVYDAPREVTLTLPDGSRKKESIMSSVQDSETGDLVVLNDLTNMEFDVFADIGPSYTNKKEQTIEQIQNMIGSAAQAGDPALVKLLVLKQAALVDGVAFDDVRDYANKQLMLMGVKEPETPEDQQFMQQQQEQQQQPDANMVIAMAAQGEAEASQMNAQTKQAVEQFKAQTAQQKTQIDAFRAQTDRMTMQVNAQETGANIDYKRSQEMGQKIDNIQKANSPFRAQAQG